MSEWQPIETAPKDGSEFQGWATLECPSWPVGYWEPRCRINPETEAVEAWGRVDYDEEGWHVQDALTHWMPTPSPPQPHNDKREK